MAESVDPFALGVLVGVLAAQAVVQVSGFHAAPVFLPPVHRCQQQGHGVGPTRERHQQTGIRDLGAGARHELGDTLGGGFQEGGCGHGFSRVGGGGARAGNPAGNKRVGVLRLC